MKGVVSKCLNSSCPTELDFIPYLLGYYKVRFVQTYWNEKKQ